MSTTLVSSGAPISQLTEPVSIITQMTVGQGPSGPGAIDTIVANLSIITTVAAAAANINLVAGDLANINLVAGDKTNIDAIVADKTNIDAVATDLTAINLVAGDLTAIDLVAGSITNLNLVAADRTLINLVGSDLSRIDAVALDLANIDALAGNLTNVNLVAGDLTNINIVAAARSNVDAVAGDLTLINAVGGSIANVNAVAGDLTLINAVAGDLTLINAVGGSIANVNAVAGDLTLINAVGGSITNVNLVAGDLTNINLVAGDKTNIDIVAADKTNIDIVAADKTNIDAVSGAVASINTVAGSIASVNTVGGAVTSVNTVATNIASINTVGGAITNVNLVAGSIANVTTVAGSIANVNTVASAVTNVNTVGGAVANVNTVATNIAAVNTNAANIAVIQTAAANAATATTQAGLATTGAATATTQAQVATAQAGLAQTYANSAASIAQQDLSGATVAALHRSPNATTAQFLYDTSKDSDGGAWIDRMQADKSWMTEPLNGTWLGPQYNELNARMKGCTVGAEVLADPDINSSAAWTTVQGSIAGGRFVRANNPNAGSAIVTLGTPLTQNQLYRIEVKIAASSAAAATSQNVGSIGCQFNQSGAAANVTAPTIIGSPGETLTFYLAPTISTVNQIVVFSNVNTYTDFESISVKPVTASASVGNLFSYYQEISTGKHRKFNRNMLAWSEDLTVGATWTRNNANGAAGTVVGGQADPLGGTAAFKYVAANGQGSPYLNNAGATISFNQTYTISFSVKSAGVNFINVQGDAIQGALTGSVWLDIVNGTITNAGANIGTATITAIAGQAGWFFVTLTSPATAAGSGCSPLWRLAATGTTLLSTGDGVNGIYLFRPQLEVGSAYTSYEAKATADASITEVFRGNRAKFPRLSAVVCDALGLVIYDLTQPGQPMWMRFVTNGANILHMIPNCLAMLNGQLVVGNSSGTGAMSLINFLSDSGVWIISGSPRYDIGKISQRNAGLGYVQSSAALPTLGTNTVNYVAMAVLPDAPIDPVTGLQVPTIAVCTSASVTVLKHDGTLVNGPTGGSFTRARFTKSGRLFSEGSNGAVVSWWLHSADFSTWTSMFSNATYSPAFSSILAGVTGPPTLLTVADKLLLGLGGNSSTSIVNAVATNFSTRAASPVAYISTGYNTGWMVGDIRRALLADVSIGSVNGAELVTSAWLTAGYWSSNSGVVFTGGTSLDFDTHNDRVQSLTGPLTVGKSYKVVFTFTRTGGLALVAYNGAGNTAYAAGVSVSPGTVSFTATDTGFGILSSAGGGAGTISLTGFSLTEIVDDRSYKVKPLSVFGTLTKTAVGTGNQLVAYSGFSSSNYLQEAYSADLDFGTGAWRIGAWLNIPVQVIVNPTQYNYASLPFASFGVAASVALSMNTAQWTKGTGWTASGGNTVSSDGSQAGQSDLVMASGNTPGTGEVRRWTLTVTAVSGAGIMFYPNAVTPSATITAPGTYVGFGNASASCIIRTTAAGVTCSISLAIDTLKIAPIAERAAAAGANITFGVNLLGFLVATAFDGTTTRTVATAAAYSTASSLKAAANYATDGTLTINVNGVTVASAIGTPLLSIDGRYNQFLSSERFDDSFWHAFAAQTTTADQILAPDGTTTGDKIAANSAGVGNGAFENTVPLQIGQELSVYGKAGNLNFLVFGNALGGTFWANFNLSTGVVGAFGAGFSSISIAVAPNGWYRCSAIPAISSGRVLFAMKSAAVAADPWGVGTVAIGDYIYLWGAQLSTVGAPYQRTGPVLPETVVPTLTIGNDRTLANPFPGSLALVKIGATVPTTEQAAFMYAQEAQMFTAGAQITLPDATAVQDLTYDESLDKWCVVTTANQSTFTGMVRTSTTAVPAGSYSKVEAKSGAQLLARITTNPGVDVSIPAQGLREELVNRSLAAARLARVRRVDDFDVISFTATTVVSSNQLTVVASVVGVPYVGMGITGTGIPAGTTIQAINGATYTMSANATAAGTAVPIAQSTFTLAVGYSASIVKTNGSVVREGSTKTWTRTFDGFKETIVYAVSPGTSGWVQVESTRM